MPSSRASGRGAALITEGLFESARHSTRDVRRRITAAVLVAALPVCFFLSLLLGSTELSAPEVFSALWFSSGDSQQDLIVTAIRLPRSLLAALIGAVLAICGAASQGLFRNPLADPSLIGVTAGASAGASLAIVFGGTLLAGAGGLWWISLGAFAGGIATVWLVYRLSTSSSGTSVASMLLAGIAITALAGSFTSLLSYLASNDLLRRISLWQMGGLDGANYPRVIAALLVATMMLAFIPRFSSALNALLLGESEAQHLGFDVARMQRWLIVLIAAGVGSSVALAGTISFVGLVVPHIVRLAIGADHRYLLPLSAAAGAVLLLMADTLARTVIAPAEIPVGLVTAVVGAPFFISLLRHRREYGMQP
ncbi:iron ABC transporter permease [Proteobacteria bacterium 005FR1]|nr:iron ABC transporter permease [Proteobacteria bacterium 005FR1]